jgi:hypothetical protein
MTIKTKTIYFILTGLLISNCGITKKDELVGHWHYVSTIYGDFKTIDISDSVIISDMYEIGTAMRGKFKRKLNDSLEVLPINHFSYSRTFFVSQDTLIIRDGEQEYKYIKSEAANCHIADSYRNSSVVIDNPLGQGKPFDITYRQFNTEHLFVGKLKREDKYCDSLSQVYPDSIFIHAKYFNWTKFQKLPRYYSFMINMWGYDKPNHYVLADNGDESPVDGLYPGEFEPIYDYSMPFGLVIHADKSVRDEFLNKIIAQVPDSISITFFRSVVNSTGYIEVVKIDNE